MANKLKILVVDDDLATLDLIGDTLELFDVVPKSTPSSRAAADLINRQKFDAVFLDWIMPEIDGLELTRRIRRSALNEQVPIVMLTVKTEAEAMREAFAAGASFFLTKPLTTEKVKRLLNAIRGAVKTDRRQSRRVCVAVDVLCAWDGQRVWGRTVTLSATGALLSLPKVPPEGIGITLVPKLPGVDQEMTLVGKVVDITEKAGGPTIIAVRFTEYRTADRTVLVDFVERMARSLPPELVF